MTDNFDDQESKSQAAVRKFMFPIWAYANRIKLKADPELRKSESANIMFGILAKKKVPLLRATNAVMRTLDAATNAEYANLRSANSALVRKEGGVLLDELISKLDHFVETISKLPPSSKSIINERIARITKIGVFDTEVLMELADCIANCLPQLSPKKTADEALSLLLPENSWAEKPRFAAQPPIVELWEAIPSITRSRVERKIEARLQLRGIALLRSIPAVLRCYRPSTRFGAPASPNFQFVREADKQWSSLGLRSGRRYDAVGARHASSTFQLFCNAALAAAGSETRISDRQIANLKRKPIVKIRKGRLTS
jgi:hypothetical protein